METNRKEIKNETKNEKEVQKNLVRPEERHYNHGDFIGPNTYKSQKMHP